MFMVNKKSRMKNYFFQWLNCGTGAENYDIKAKGRVKRMKQENLIEDKILREIFKKNEAMKQFVADQIICRLEKKLYCFQVLDHPLILRRKSKTVEIKVENGNT
ncbi:hypothetical protein Ahy_A02g005758 isoform A [Arachis hypogaea]|uniref:Uncharacterized protein n=1 Tax=Arachis hypogaea TaxID=3818 RepID=A0A445E7Q4_ARAHY|nr:hypothetical protein Ahy_A02g005758 isoform A [Arachis hypogaea]